MKTIAVLPATDLCGVCRKFRKTHFVIVRAVVNVDVEACTRCTHKILRKHPTSEAAELIESKRGAN